LGSSLVVVVVVVVVLRRCWTRRAAFLIRAVVSLVRNWATIPTPCALMTARARLAALVSNGEPAVYTKPSILAIKLK
jgi:hypothetical protein